MNQDKNWNPGHDIHNGYPWEGIISRETFVNRLDVKLNEEGKPIISYDVDKFPNMDGAFDPEKHPKDIFVSEIMNRLYDYSVALGLAEDQISAMLDEFPFIPEDMGFDLLASHSDLKEVPYRIYGPKNDPDFSIYREPGNIDDRSWDPSIWTVIKNKNGVTQKIEVKLPCRRIAYAVFYSLGMNIKQDEREGSMPETVKEEEPVQEKP